MLSRLLINLAGELSRRSENVNLLAAVPPGWRWNTARGLYIVQPRATITTLIENHQLTTLQQLVDKQCDGYQPELTRADMVTALRTGLVEIVRFLVLHGVGLYFRDINLAAESGSLELVNYLVQVGLRPTARAIEQAARYGHLELIKHLIELGVRPSVNTLIGGAASGRIDILEYLYQLLIQDQSLDETSEVRPTTNDPHCNRLIIPKDTFEEALEEATRHNHLVALQWLLRTGRGETDQLQRSVKEYNDEMLDEAGYTLYDIAYGYGHQAIIDWLVVNGVEDQVRGKALVVAFEAANDEVIIDLYNEYIDWISDVIGIDASIPIRHLIEVGSLDTLKYLSRWYFVDEFTELMVKLMAEMNQVDAIKWAINNFADIDDDILDQALAVTNQLGTFMFILGLMDPKYDHDVERIASHAAAIGNQVLLKKSLELFTQHPPDLNSVAHKALTHGQYSLVDILNLPMTNLPEQTVSKVMERDYVNTLDYLLQHGVELPHDAMQTAVCHNSQQVATYLRRRGYTVEKWCVAQTLELVELMYTQLGPPPDQVIDEHILRNDQPVIKFLAIRGYQFRPDHVTPATIYDRLTILAIMYQYGLRATIKDLNAARRYNHHQIVRFLEEHGVDG